MKIAVVLATFLVTLVSCSKKMESKKTPIAIRDTTSKVILVGGDLDVHGCKSSAGYTWSVLKKECVRVFEVGTRLQSNQNDASSAFVIFETNGNKAELFTTLEKNSLILERKAEGQPWINGDWQLIPWKGLVLKRGDEILFTGQ
jgi:hypothetical protein